MKESFSLLALFLSCAVLLCSCGNSGGEDKLTTSNESFAHAPGAEPIENPEAPSGNAESDMDYVFEETKDGIIVNNIDGSEYAFLAHEGQIVPLCEERCFIGRIKGEEKYLRHLGMEVLAGMYALDSEDNNSILVRIYPDSEWYSLYRNSELPKIDLSVDNLSRIELVNGLKFDADPAHASCGFGLTGEQLYRFFEDVRSSKTADEAGLRDHSEYMENCYQASTIFGFFEDEPNIAMAMNITSYSDLVYTVEIVDGDSYDEYIIPDDWMDELIKAAHLQESDSGYVQIIPPPN